MVKRVSLLRISRDQTQLRSQWAWLKTRRPRRAAPSLNRYLSLRQSLQPSLLPNQHLGLRPNLQHGLRLDPQRSQRLVQRGQSLAGRQVLGQVLSRARRPADNLQLGRVRNRKHNRLRSHPGSQQSSQHGNRLRNLQRNRQRNQSHNQRSNQSRSRVVSRFNGRAFNRRLLKRSIVPMNSIRPNPSRHQTRRGPMESRFPKEHRS